MPDVLPAARWADYLAGYHDAHPGITEDVLVDAHDRDGRTPYDWLVEAVPGGVSTVVDLACGSGPVGRRLSAGRVIGIDRSAAELARGRAGDAGALLVRAQAPALPVAGGRADAVVASMALMLLHPLDATLLEVSRLLRRGGTFVATTPVRAVSPGPSGTPAFSGILAALGQNGLTYPEPLDDGPLAVRFASAGLTLLADVTAPFVRTVRGPDDAWLTVRSFYSPGAAADQIEAAVEELRRQVRAAPVEIVYRIRRVVARR